MASLHDQGGTGPELGVILSKVAVAGALGVWLLQSAPDGQSTVPLAYVELLSARTLAVAFQGILNDWWSGWRSQGVENWLAAIAADDSPMQ